MEPIEIIQISPTERVTLHYDDTPENPRAFWPHITGAFTHTPEWNTIDVRSDHAFPGDLRRASNEISVVLKYSADWRSRTPLYDNSGGVIRWAAIFYQITLVDDGRTFWWVDPKEMHDNWPTLEVGTPEYIQREKEIIAGDQAEYEAWSNNEVYGIQRETLTTWVKVDENRQLTDDEFVQWEMDDSVWGVYINDSYTFEQAAKEQGYTA